MALNDLTRISTSGIATGTTIDSPVLRKDVSLRGSQVGVTSVLFDSSDDALEFNDNVKIKLGNSGDLELYHDGNDNTNYIRSNNGDLVFRDDTIKLKAFSTQDTYLTATNGGSVSLRHDNSIKFETAETGAVVTGILTATSFSGPIGNPSGISTFYDLKVTNNLTVEGTTTTLDTNLVGVDRVEVGANSNSVVGVAITQSGSADIVNLFDGTTEVLTVVDGGSVGIKSATPDTNFVLDAVGSGIFTKEGTFTSNDFNKGQFTVRNITASQGAFLDFRAASSNGARGVIAKIGGFNTKTGSGYEGELTFSTRQNSDNTMVERLRIDSSGQVGIGTNDPDALLDVDGDVRITGIATALRLDVKNGSQESHFAVNQIQFNPTAAAYIDHKTTSQDIIFRVSNSSAMDTTSLTLKSDGKVGIGTDNPASNMNLHVLDKTDRCYVTFESGGNESSQLWLKNPARTWKISNYYDQNSLTFTDDSDERLRITSAGDVGISSTSPRAKLDVKDANTGKDVILRVSADNNTPYALVVGNDAFNTTGSRGLAMWIGTDKVHHISARTSATANENELKISATDAIYFGTGSSNTEALRITSDRKVGIGTDDPDHSLHVYKEGGDSVITIESTGNDNHSALEFIRTSSAGNGKGAGSIYVTGNTGGSEAIMHFGVGHNISHGQVPRLSIKGDGEVGIGTENPSTMLHIKSTFPTLLVEGTNDTVGYTVSKVEVRAFYYRKAGFTISGDNGTEDIFIGRPYGSGETTAPLVFNFQGTEQVRIKSDGKVGIGTDQLTTDAKLDVWGDGSAYPTLRLGTEVYDTEGEDIRFGRTDIGNVDIRYHSIRTYHHADNSSNYMKFDLHDGGSAPFQSQNTVLFLRGDNKVGIAYDSPRTALEINATHITTDDTVTPVLRLSTGTSYGGSNTGSALEFGTTNTSYPSWVKGRIGCVYNGSSAYGGHLVFQTNTGSGAAALSEKMRITDGGVVCVGTEETAMAVYSGTDRGVNITGNGRVYCKTADHWDLNHVGAGQIIRFRYGADSGTQTHVGHIQVNSSSVTYSQNSSDSRNKKNVETWTEEVLPHFKTLQPKKFNYNWESDSDTKTKGYMAQDLTSVFPEGYPMGKMDIDGSEEDRYMFNPSGMVTYLMKALQEEIVKREEIEAKYNALEARISALEGS